jgi:hypothetical protein
MLTHWHVMSTSLCTLSHKVDGHFMLPYILECILAKCSGGLVVPNELSNWINSLVNVSLMTLTDTDMFRVTTQQSLHGRAPTNAMYANLPCTHRRQHNQVCSWTNIALWATSICTALPVPNGVHLSRVCLDHFLCILLTYCYIKLRPQLTSQLLIPYLGQVSCLFILIARD